MTTIEKTTVQAWRHALRITAAVGLIGLLGGTALPSATAATFEDPATMQTAPEPSDSGTPGGVGVKDLPPDEVDPEATEPEAIEAELSEMINEEPDPVDTQPAQPAENDTEATGAPAAENVLPPDAGITLPGGRDQAVGDVLDLGYEQIVRVNGSKVEITEPATRGGEVIRSFEAGTRNDFPTRHYYGGYQLGDIAKQGGSHVAVLGQNIYVSTFVLDPERSVNRSEVRKYRNDGSWEFSRQFPNDHAVTALSAVRHQGKDLLAIGLNRGGVRVAHTDRQGLPDFRELHLDWNGRCFKCFDRDMVTAVKLYTADDGRHRLMLVAGRFTYGTEAVVATDLDFQRDPHGDVKHAGIEMWRNNKRPDNLNTWEWPDVLEAGTFGPSKRTQVAISWPSSRRTTFLDGIHGANFTSNDAQETTAIRFFKDADDEHRVAIRRGGSSVIAGVNASGQLYYTHWNLNDSTIPSAAPGYRAWSLTLENRTSREISLKTFADAKRERGCWYGGSQLKGVARPLPIDATIMAAGGTAGPFGTAQRTVGEDCTGEHPGAFYVQVDVDRDSGNRRVAKLLGDRHGIRVDGQVGAGVVDVSTERHGVWGVRIVVTERLGEPTLRAAPTLDAKRLTPLPTAPDDGDVHDANRPVFRFTVGGAVWHVPGADSDRSSATVTVPTAQGSADGTTWVDLGTVTSPLAPTRLGDDTVKLGDGEFYWQTEAGAAHYRYFQVALPDGTRSNTIDTGDTAAVPPPPPVVGEVTSITMTSIGTGPRRNGLDQVPIRVSVAGTGKVFDPGTRPDLYDRLYFRDTGLKKLITGLGKPTDGPQLVMLSRQPGQYSNDTAGAEDTAMTFYASTMMDYRNPSIAPYLKLEGKRGALSHSGKTMPAAPTSKLSSKGLAGEGLSVDGCTEGACVLTPPTDQEPAMYGLTPRTISLQFRTPAIHGSDSLPLSDTRAEERQLFSDPMRHVSGKANLVQPAKFGTNASITTHLITHGERVLADNHLVKQKG